MLNGCFVNPSSATKLVQGNRSRLHKAMTSLFSQGGLWISTPPPLLQTTHHSSCKQRRLYFIPSPSSSPLLSLPSPHLFLPPSLPPSLPLCFCGVTACRCCVRVSSAGAVWSECVVSSSAERLLTGWMRESNTVYFNLFRMPELCPGFLLSLIPQLAASIPHSCGAV